MLIAFPHNFVNKLRRIPKRVPELACSVACRTVGKHRKDKTHQMRFVRFGKQINAIIPRPKTLPCQKTLPPHPPSPPAVQYRTAVAPAREIPSSGEICSRTPQISPAPRLCRPSQTVLYECWHTSCDTHSSHCSHHSGCSARSFTEVCSTTVQSRYSTMQHNLEFLLAKPDCDESVVSAALAFHVQPPSPFNWQEVTSVCHTGAASLTANSVIQYRAPTKDLYVGRTPHAVCCRCLLSAACCLLPVLLPCMPVTLNSVICWAGPHTGSTRHTRQTRDPHWGLGSIG